MPVTDNPDTSGNAGNAGTPVPSTPLIPPAVIQGAIAKIASAAADLAPYMESVDAGQRRHMRRISPRDRDGIHRAEAIARANPKFRPGFLSIDDFSARLANTDGLEALRDPLATLSARVNDTIQIEETHAANSASAVYKLIQVAASLKDPDAQAAEIDLASRMPKRGRTRTSKPAAGTGAAGSAGSPAGMPAKLTWAGSSAGGHEGSEG